MLHNEDHFSGGCIPGLPGTFTNPPCCANGSANELHNCLKQPSVRKFETGATRDTDTGKLDYEAFFSPAVLERRAVFMHKNRKQSDGGLRDGDNWQKGIPFDQYVKSLHRHFMDIWKEHRGIKTDEGMESAICAAMFNLEGMLFELLKAKT